MAWTDSRVLRSFVTDTLAGTAVFDIDAPSDTYKVALYNNSGTPDKDATSANSAYNAGAWVTGNEVSQVGQWAAGGVALTSMTVTNPSSGVIKHTAANPSSGTAATLAAVYGSLEYDDSKTTPVAKQAVCFNYFGGTNTVTNGQLSVIWSSSGIFTVTV
jgi:hypothetical protein